MTSCFRLQRSTAVFGEVPKTLWWQSVPSLGFLKLTDRVPFPPPVSPVTSPEAAVSRPRWTWPWGCWCRPPPSPSSWWVCSSSAPTPSTRRGGRATASCCRSYGTAMDLGWRPRVVSTRDPVSFYLLLHLLMICCRFASRDQEAESESDSTELANMA